VLLAVAGCNQSLFDAFGDRGDGGPGDDGGGGDGGGDGPDVPETCPVGACVGDASADFNGAQGGTSGHWRYLEDLRNRMWAPMGMSGSGLSGVEDNHVARCTSAVAACQALPGALLVTSSGQFFDPAIEFRQFPTPQVIQLALRVRGQTGTHLVRLYRNSREDVLFTGTAPAEKTIETTLTVDALLNDRFYVALEPTGGVGGIAAVQFFVVDPKMSFPEGCQMAVSFTTAGSIADAFGGLCGGDDELRSFLFEMPSKPAETADAFTGPNGSGAVQLEPEFNLRGIKQLDRSGAFTLQFWLRLDANFQNPTAWVFSDLDPGNGSGLGIHVIYDTPVKLAAAILDPGLDITRQVPYPDPFNYHFVRVIHTSSAITICLDGKQAMSFPSPGPVPSFVNPFFGRNANVDVTNYLLAGLDDVRVFSGTLPCN
jgi:hypothetical protein